MIAYADSHTVPARNLLELIEDNILFPLIALLTAIALLYFLWGLFQYVLNAESDEARSTGKKHMLYGIIGFVIMVSAYAIIEIATWTFGITIG